MHAIPITLDSATVSESIQLLQCVTGEERAFELETATADGKFFELLRLIRIAEQAGMEGSFVEFEVKHFSTGGTRHSWMFVVPQEALRKHGIAMRAQ
jgi:hypothetical protein